MGKYAAENGCPADILENVLVNLFIILLNQSLIYKTIFLRYICILFNLSVCMDPKLCFL